MVNDEYLLKQDKLDEIWHRNQKLREMVFERNELDYDMDLTSEWVEKNVIALMSELGEFANETDFKWWKQSATVDNEEFREELIDILFFWMQLAEVAYDDPQDLFEEYINKWEVNVERQESDY